jgi:hypothetical protein
MPHATSKAVSVAFREQERMSYCVWKAVDNELNHVVSFLCFA